MDSRKKHFLLAGLAAAMSIGLSGVASADTATTCEAKKGCEAKFCAIESELAEARAHGNTRKAAGLQTALTEAHASCTDGGLLRERQEKIDRAQRKVDERQSELDRATKGGKQGKIDKAQRKLEEAQTALQSAKAAP